MKAKLYTIVAFYVTGDSFNSEDTQTDVLEHDNLEVARENMLRIKAHYEYYQACDNISRRNDNIEKLTAKVIQETWFVNHPRIFNKKSGIAVDKIPKGKDDDYEVRPDSYHAEHCLILKTDEGADFQLSAPWCDYFGHLKAVEIVLSKEFWRIEF